MSHIRKRSSGNYYKTVDAYAEDWRLMFANARQYNQEGSWVYNDAQELAKVFEHTFRRETAGTDLPGAQGSGGGGGGGGGSSYQQWTVNPPPQQQQQQMYHNQQMQQSARKQPAPSRRKVADPDWSDGDYGSE